MEVGVNVYIADVKGTAQLVSEHELINERVTHWLICFVFTAVQWADF